MFHLTISPKIQSFSVTIMYDKEKHRILTFTELGPAEVKLIDFFTTNHTKTKKLSFFFNEEVTGHVLQ